MKIILFAEALINRAGIERMTVELAALLANDHDVSIILIRSFDPNKSPYKIDSRVNVISLDSKFSGLNIKNIRAFRKIVKSLTPDVIISVAIPMVRVVAPAICGLGIKHIAWEHFNLYAGSRKGVLWRLLSSRLVDKTVVLTEADAKDYHDRNAPNIIAIPNFTSIGKNNPSKCENKILLAVGRHDEQKGFDMLIKAWAKANVPDWKLKIVGNGKLKETNKTLAKNLNIENSIIFIDSTDNIAHEFQSASCFILSSRYEGLVLVLIEAKMMGLPCISFDCPNSPREIINDGIDGWLVKNGNIDALAECITRTLSAPCLLPSYGQKARQDAFARYSPQAVKSIWNNLLTQLVKSHA